MNNAKSTREIDVSTCDESLGVNDLKPNAPLKSKMVPENRSPLKESLSLSKNTVNDKYKYADNTSCFQIDMHEYGVPQTKLK